MADYDKFMKLFGGEWTWARDEKMDEVTKHAKLAEEEAKMVTELRPNVCYARDGDAIIQTYKVGPGMEYANTLIFGQSYESKDAATPPTFHIKVTPSFKNGIYKQDEWGLVPGKEKNWEMTTERVGVEIITESWVMGDPSVKGKRVYKKA